MQFRFLHKTATLFLLILTSLLSNAQQVIIQQENFNASASGWTFTNFDVHDWKWYIDQGDATSGGLRMKLPSTNNFFASPSLFLQAGKTYTCSFKARMVTGLTSRRIHAAYNTVPNRAGSTLFY